MALVSLLEPDEVDSEAAETLRQLAADRGDVPNIYRSMAHSPRLMTQFVKFVETLWRETKIPRTLQELLILRAAQLMHSNYEWGRHRMLARRVGVAEEKVVELANWNTSSRFDDTERAALAYADAVATGAEIPEHIVSKLRNHFDEQTTVEITMTASFYVGVAQYLRSLQIELEPGFESLTQP